MHDLLGRAGTGARRSCAVTKANSATKSRAAIAVDRVRRRVREAQLRGDLPPGPGRSERAGQRARAVRRVSGRAVVPVAQPVQVAQQRPARGPAGGGRTGPAARAGGGCVPASRRRGAAPPARPARRPASSTGPATPRAWSRRYSRTVVATWSLRDRPARSLPPSSRRAARAARAPARCARPRRRGRAGTRRPRRRPRSSSSAGQHPPARRRSSSPARASTRACARDPAMSYGRQPPVELDAHRQPGQRLGGPTGEPAAPQPSVPACSRQAQSSTPLIRQSQLRSRLRGSLPVPVASYGSRATRSRCRPADVAAAHPASCRRAPRRGRLAGDDQDGVVAGDGAEDVGQAGAVDALTPGTGPRPAGSAARPGCRCASAETSSSRSSRISRASKAAASPAAARSPPSRVRRRPAARSRRGP